MMNDVGPRIVASVGSVVARLIWVGAVGWVLNATVNVAWPPVSVVTRPLVLLIVIPAVSLSLFVTLTFGITSPGKFDAVTEIVYATGPSAMKSFSPVTMTGIVGLAPGATT